jgi:hypothetical protein
MRKVPKISNEFSFFTRLCRRKAKSVGVRLGFFLRIVQGAYVRSVVPVKVNPPARVEPPKVSDGKPVACGVIPA